MSDFIEVRDLWKRFGDDRPWVLKGIDLSIEKSKLTVIMGLSGSGKSVLFKHIIRLLKPTKGAVYVGGQNFSQAPETEVRKFLRNFGMVFQHSALFDSMSTFDNIAFPMREHTRMSEAEIREKVLKLLNVVGLQGADEKYPAELSGGMQKRAGLARAFALDPEVILFDEPTSGLDPIMSVVIVDLIERTHARMGYTGIVITHSLEVAMQIGDKVAFLLDGKIRLAGPPKAFMESDDPAVRQFREKSPYGPIDFLGERNAAAAES